MTWAWTDERGVTHEVLTFSDREGNVLVRTSRDSEGPYADLGQRAWMRCEVRAPPRSKESLRVVDCMACLVKGAT